MKTSVKQNKIKSAIIVLNLGLIAGLVALTIVLFEAGAFAQPRMLTECDGADCPWKGGLTDPTSPTSLMGAPGIINPSALGSFYLQFNSTSTPLDNKVAVFEDEPEFFTMDGTVVAVSNGEVYEDGVNIGSIERIATADASGTTSGEFNIHVGDSGYSINVNSDGGATVATRDEFHPYCENLQFGSKVCKKATAVGGGVGIDLAVFYTPNALEAARRDAGTAVDGRLRLLQKIAGAVGQFRLASCRSSLQQRIRVIQAMPIPDSSQYVVSGQDKSSGAALSSLLNDTKIDTIRKKLGADLVTIITAPPVVDDGAVPALTALAPNKGFNVIPYSKLGFQFVHLLGHNMGLGHQPSAGGADVWPGGDTALTSTPYSHGFSFTIPSTTTSLGSIMTMNTSFRLPTFSSSSASCQMANPTDLSDDRLFSSASSNEALVLSNSINARTVDTQCDENGKRKADLTHTLTCTPAHVADYMPEKIRLIRYAVDPLGPVGSTLGVSGLGAWLKIGTSINDAIVRMGPQIPAGSNQVDKILVAPGIYRERILINRDVIIESIAGPTTTTIDAGPGALGDSSNGNNEAVAIRGTDSLILANTVANHIKPTLSGFTIKNGYGNLGAGGINCTGRASPVITNNVIQDNTSYSGSGAGIAFQGCAGEISNNIVVGNRITGVCPSGNDCVTTFQRPASERRGGAGVYISDVCRYRPSNPSFELKKDSCPDTALTGTLKVFNNLIYYNDIATGLMSSISNVGAGIFIEKNTAANALTVSLANNTITANRNIFTSSAWGVGIGCRTDGGRTYGLVDFINNLTTGNTSQTGVSGVKFEGSAINLSCSGATGITTAHNYVGKGSYTDPLDVLSNMFVADPSTDSNRTNWRLDSNPMNPKNVGDINTVSTSPLVGEYVFGLHLKKVDDSISVCGSTADRQSKVIDQGMVRADTSTLPGAPLVDALGHSRSNDTYVHDAAGAGLPPYDIGALERKLSSQLCIATAPPRIVGSGISGGSRGGGI